MMVRITVILASLAFTSCATLGFGSPEPNGRLIDRILESPPLDQMHVGVFVIDANTGRALYTQKAHQKFVPASNQKILITSAALSLLGPNYRFRTDVWAAGPSDGSLLDGDLVVVGSGDPSMSSRYWVSGTAALDAIADSLRAAGLMHVTGSALIDVSAWDSTSVGPTREVEDLRYTHGSTGGAFTIDEGEVQVIVRAGSALGTPALVEWFPRGTDDFVRSRIRTSPPDSGTHVIPTYLPESRQLLLEGVAELGSIDTMTFALRDPVRQASAGLSSALRRAGIEVDGRWDVRWREGERVGRGCLAGMLDECEGAEILTTLRSPRLSALIAGILAPSQNWMAEQLIRALGASLGQKGSWSEGVRVVESYLTDKVGVDTLDVVTRDGSGLSAYNLITPRALVQILREMHLGPHATVYRSAMAEPGKPESTLEERLMELEGRLFAKSGTITNVNSLSGYLVRENGQEIIFSILTNGSGRSSSSVTGAIDEIVRILAR